MPKTRSSGNTIGSRNEDGIGNGHVNQEMSERIEERLNEVRSITVPMYSRTRGMMENLEVTFTQPGLATVSSGSGEQYLVDIEEETCTCPNNHFAGARCRHIEGVALAQEQTGQGTSQGSLHDNQIDVNQTLRRHIANEVTEETNNAERQYIDDGHFYADDPEAFSRDLERMRTEEIPYEYDNVLNGSNITFGIELEFVDGAGNEIARELYDLGICSSPRRLGYHARQYDRTKWKLESDSSVTHGRFGGELVSPILTDTPETWRNIETICEVVKRHGGRVNVDTGAHVHISVEPLDGKRQRWRRLFKSFAGTEEAVLRYSGGEMGEFRNTSYTRRSQRELQSARVRRLPEEGDLFDFRSALRNVGWEKYRTFNLKPFASGVRNTLEIRSFNGTLTPGIIQGNVKVASGLIHTAERSRRTGEDGLVNEFNKRRGEMIEDYQGNDRNETTMIRFVDTYFPRKKDKEHIMTILAKNSWS